MENPLRTWSFPSAEAENPLRAISANPLLIPPMWVEAAVDDVAEWFHHDNVPSSQPLHGEVATVDDDVEMLDSSLDEQVQDLGLGNPSLDSSLDEERECAICMEVITDPVTTECNHTFCGGCILPVLAHGDVRARKCPLCRRANPSLRRGL